MTLIFLGKIEHTCEDFSKNDTAKPFTKFFIFDNDRASNARYAMETKTREI